ncbi:MAG TPA: nucleotide-binding domain containing protein, partial [Beutenbergiaceae bacterium]|nr:nucleotide-binding domain containing protein [Beutenbergiaceae bacterium]
SYRLDVNQIMDNHAAYLDSTLTWYRSHESSTLAPLIYATATPEQVRETQERYGAEKVGGAIEGFFSSLASALVSSGVKTVITAGGETSGAVTNALDIEAFEVGINIAPGVPLMRSLDGRVYLVLKSGNFGSEEFFFEAQGAKAHG